MMQGFRRSYRSVRLPALIVAFVLGLLGSSKAQTPEQFYKGKLLDLEIGYPTGGSNDAYGRVLANHLGKHIPGAPTIVPRNTPGAGSFLAVNRVANTAPRVHDSMNRPLDHYPFGTYIVQHGEAWVASSWNYKSFDSRYFGPVRLSAIRHYLRPFAFGGARMNKQWRE